MTKLEFELKQYKLREEEISRRTRDLQELETIHQTKTALVFGIAPHGVASVESVIEAIQRVIALQNENV